MFKMIFFNLLCALGYIFSVEGSQKLNKDYIEKVFKEVIEDLKADKEIISQYFSPDYIQYVDGHVLNYEEFVQHMLVQKTLLDSIQVYIERCIIEGNAICTVHKVYAIKKTGEKLVVQVVSYFEIENGKITLCDELTHLLEGSEKDRNIGSVK